MLTKMRASARQAGFIIVLAAGLVACGTPSFSVPPDSAAPSVVLDAYLRALLAGDCGAGKALGTGTFRPSNGDLCGDTQVTAFQVMGDPATPSDGEVVFGTKLTTSGSRDGTVPPATSPGSTSFNARRAEPGVSRVEAAVRDPIAVRRRAKR